MLKNEIKTSAKATVTISRSNGETETRIVEMSRRFGGDVGDTNTVVAEAVGHENYNATMGKSKHWTGILGGIQSGGRIMCPFLFVSEKIENSNIVKMVSHKTNSQVSPVTKILDIRFNEEDNTSTVVLEQTINFSAVPSESHSQNILGVAITSSPSSISSGQTCSAIWSGRFKDEEGKDKPLVIKGFETAKVTVEIHLIRKHSEGMVEFEVRGNKYKYKYKTFHGKRGDFVEKGEKNYSIFCGLSSEAAWDYVHSVGNISNRRLTLLSFIQGSVDIELASKVARIIGEVLDSKGHDFQITLKNITESLVAHKDYEEGMLNLISKAEETSSTSFSQFKFTPSDINGYMPFLFSSENHVFKTFLTRDAETNSADLLDITLTLFPWALYPVIDEESPEIYKKTADDVMTFGLLTEYT